MHVPPRDLLGEAARRQRDMMSPADFTIKDSGERREFASGMVRDVTEGKTNYTLILDGPMFDRWAEHMTKGAQKYAARNWMRAQGQEEYERFKESALRHFLQWFRGETDEDHAAAVFFNLNGAEYVKARMDLAQEITDALTEDTLDGWSRAIT